MREDIAKLVYPVLTAGLALKDRLERGETPSLDGEQAALKGLLLTPEEARRWPAFGGVPIVLGESVDPDVAKRPRFLGLRYALTCWLDELFIRYSSWEAAWNESKLEMALYGSNDRAWKFWEQVRLEEARPESEALEGLYLCVMLGFRGELSADAERLRSWTTTAKRQLDRELGRSWTPPPRLEPPTEVPPLRQRRRFRKAVLTAGLLLLILVPLLAQFLVRQLGK